MNMLFYALVGTALFVIGSIKTYLHVSMGSVVAFPTCNGDNVLVSVSQGSFFAQAHCWGCYVALAGLLMASVSMVQYLRQKRPLAFELD